MKAWLIEWDRSWKTKANYHGLIFGVFAYAVKRGYLAANPAKGTAPKQSRVKQSRPELRFLTERELPSTAPLTLRTRLANERALGSSFVYAAQTWRQLAAIFGEQDARALFALTKVWSCSAAQEIHSSTAKSRT